MALTALFEHIGAKLKIANPWLDTYAVNCIQLPDKSNGGKGEVVNFLGEEKEYLGIDDSKGSAFYIRTNPKFTYTPQKQLSSCGQNYEVTVPFKFVFFAINQPENYNPLKIENLFANNLREMNFSDYTGGERKAKLVVLNSNTDAFQVFFDEIGKKFDVGANAICVSIECQLKFLSTTDCEEQCGTSTGADILHTFDFCDPAVIARLCYAQVICLQEHFGGGGGGLTCAQLASCDVIINLTTRITALENAGFLTCDTLAACQVIIDIQALLPTQDQKDAMDNANAPDGSNPFATMLDIATVAGLTLNQVLTNGNETGGVNIIVSDSDLISSFDGTNTITFGSGNFVFAGGANFEFNSVGTFDVNSQDIINLNATNVINFNAPVYNFTQATANYIPFIDASNNMVASFLSQDSNYIYLDSGKEFASNDTFSIYRFPDVVSGNNAGLVFTNGAVIATQTAGQNNSGISWLNATVSGNFNLTVASAAVNHTVQITFNSPIYNFAQLTASTVVYLNASKNLVSLANGAGVLTNNGAGVLTWVAAGTPVTSVSGTANRITSTGGTTPVIDIAATYVGQTSITTLGTIVGTAIWNAGAVTTPSLTSPLIIGGAAVGSTITYKPTTGIGTPGVSAHLFTGGTDGGTILFALRNDGVATLIGTLDITTSTTSPLFNNIAFTIPASAATLTLGSGTTTIITGGGTLGLGGFTLTIPATGTAALGTGGAGGIAIWTGANTLTQLADVAVGSVLVSGGVGNPPAWSTTVPSGSLVYSNTSVPAGNTIANTAAETTFSLPSYSIPANSLVAGSVIRVKLWGVYSTDVVAPTINIKLKLNGTTYLASGNVTAIALVTNGGWFADAVLTIFSIGAGGTVDAQAYGEFSTAATTGLSVNVPNTGTQAIDTTIAQAVTVTADWGVADTDNSITLRSIAIYVENLSTIASAGTFLQVANNLSDLPNPVTARANLGLTIGTDVAAIGDVYFTLIFLCGPLSPADNTTYYFSISTVTNPSTTEANQDANYGYAFTVIGATIVTGGNSTGGTAENSTLQLRNITQGTSASIGTFTTNASTTVTTSHTHTGLNISVGASDFIAMQWDTPAWVINPVNARPYVTLFCKRV